ncbi:hypothetical protein GCM10010174_67010 [Kutzneria viridogrisea]|uniref:Uncharacterized protein n=1 Tax=Kutzneria viridogrisea TaxID=47990 RepID=A0ABR6B9T7_9PSEU|nr:hypothetical protein [Kutzneria viridogrisea]
MSDTWAPLFDRLFRSVLVPQAVLVVFGFGQVESVLPIVLRDSTHTDVTYHRTSGHENDQRIWSRSGPSQ